MIWPYGTEHSLSWCAIEDLNSLKVVSAHIHGCSSERQPKVFASFQCPFCLDKLEFGEEIHAGKQLVAHCNAVSEECIVRFPST
jgi:hypothetical protein